MKACRTYADENVIGSDGRSLDAPERQDAGRAVLVLDNRLHAALLSRHRLVDAPAILHDIRSVLVPKDRVHRIGLSVSVSTRRTETMGRFRSRRVLSTPCRAAWSASGPV